jgi:hypothetical protein
MPNPRTASPFQSDRNWISSRSSAWLQAVCVQHESREIAYGVTPDSSNSALLSRRSWSSFVQVEDQANRKKTKSAERPATRFSQLTGSRGAIQTLASGIVAPGSSMRGPYYGDAGQHHETLFGNELVSGAFEEPPNCWTMFETDSTLADVSLRNSHWFALTQPTSSQFPFGEIASVPKSPGAEYRKRASPGSVSAW